MPENIDHPSRAWRDEARRRGPFKIVEWLHGYAYARWPYAYIGAATGGRPWLTALFSPLIALMGWLTPFTSTAQSRTGDPGQKRPTFADGYHGKAMPLDQAERLIRLDRPVETSLPEQVLPYTRARDIILHNPDSIALLDCPCRASRENPCTPLDVCIVVGEPFASFILKHHPDRARRITPDEAVEVVRAENARGHVAHAFFKDAMLGRYYAICNCCSCCCGAMQAYGHGVQMLCSSGYLAQVDPEACVGCGVCSEYCQFKAIAVRDKMAVIDTAACMGCGVCTSKCAKGALSLRLAPEKGEPLPLDAMAG